MDDPNQKKKMDEEINFHEITTGAHNSVPMCIIAHKAGCKVIFIETFAALEKPTKAGSMIYKIADHFIVQWENMLKFYPKAEFGGWIF